MTDGEEPMRGLGAALRTDGVMTSLWLPDGSVSGGLLVPVEGRLHVVLFTDERLAVGDRVGVPPGRCFTVTAIRSARLDGRLVTALEVRPLDPGDSEGSSTVGGTPVVFDRRRLDRSSTASRRGSATGP